MEIQNEKQRTSSMLSAPKLIQFHKLSKKQTVEIKHMYLHQNM